MANIEDKDTVLVVDDEPEIVEAVKGILTKAGFDVITASDGKIAFDSFSERLEQNGGDPSIKAIVSDWKMPNWDGVQLLKSVRGSLFPQVGFVLISGAVTREQLEEALTLSADGVLLKPFKAELLIEKVSDAIAKREAMALQTMMQNI